MKKLLSIYLSLSLALMPVLANAQTSNDVTRAQQGLESELSKVQNILNKNGVKILSGKNNEEVTLEEAMKSGDFIADASVAGLEIVKVKKLLVTEAGQVTLALSILNDLKDTASTRVTAVIIDVNKSAEENALRIKNSLQNLIAKTDSKRNVASSSMSRGEKFVIGMLLLAADTMIFFSVIMVIDKMHQRVPLKPWEGKLAGVGAVVFIGTAMFGGLMMSDAFGL